MNLARFDRAQPGWMISDADLWWIPEYLLRLPHRPLLTQPMVRALTRADRRSRAAGLVGYRDA